MSIYMHQPIAILQLAMHVHAVINFCSLHNTSTVITVTQYSYCIVSIHPKKAKKGVEGIDCMLLQCMAEYIQVTTYACHMSFIYCLYYLIVTSAQLTNTTWTFLSAIVFIVMYHHGIYIEIVCAFASYVQLQVIALC